MKTVKSLLVAVLILWTVPAMAQPNSTAWVVNSLASTMSRVDLTTGNVNVNALSLGQYPNDVVISGSTAYVPNSGDNQIQLIDLLTGQTSGTIELLQGLNPWAIALDGNQRAYVSNYLSGNVSVLDLTTNQEIDTLGLGTSPEGVCVYQNVLYVTDSNVIWPFYGQGYVHAYSLPALNHLAVIPVATNPQIIKPGPDGLLHVVCTGDFNAVHGQIQLINPTTLALMDSIAIGSYPWSLTFTSQGIGYLGTSTLTGNGEILSYDGITHQIIHGVLNPITVASGVFGLASLNNGHLLACCFNIDQLLELDGDGNQVRIFTVGDGPAAVAVWEPPSAIPVDQPVARTILLNGNYPEPFNGTTTIHFSLKTQQIVTLTVYDTSGKLVEITNFGSRPAGVVQLPFQPASTLSSGRYLYRLQAGTETATGTVTYLK